MGKNSDDNNYDLFFFKMIYPTRKSLQSFTFPGPEETYRANNAVDRNVPSCMRTVDIGLRSTNKTVWWKVDLGGLYSLYSIDILFKSYQGLYFLLSKNWNEMKYKFEL